MQLTSSPINEFGRRSFENWVCNNQLSRIFLLKFRGINRWKMYLMMLKSYPIGKCVVVIRKWLLKNCVIYLIQKETINDTYLIQALRISIMVKVGHFSLEQTLSQSLSVLFFDLFRPPVLVNHRFIRFMSHWVAC